MTFFHPLLYTPLLAHTKCSMLSMGLLRIKTNAHSEHEHVSFIGLYIAYSKYFSVQESLILHTSRIATHDAALM